MVIAKSERTLRDINAKRRRDLSAWQPGACSGSGSYSQSLLAASEAFHAHNPTVLKPEDQCTRPSN